MIRRSLKLLVVASRTMKMNSYRIFVTSFRVGAL
jgi:hypothetical protein